MYKNRYIRNKILTNEEQKLLKNKTVVVFGCGGLGGYIIEELARIGIGKLIVCDIDIFKESNLNRQILCKENDLGREKALVAKERVSEINSEISIESTSENLFEDVNKLVFIIKKVDVVVDALDSIKNKKELEKVCKECNKILIHGAIGGWQGQASTIFPGDNTISKFYGDNIDIEDKLGNPSFTPAIVASIEVAETIKVLIGKTNRLLSKKMLVIDLENNDFEVIEMD
ncbi:MAG: HesA/MoeB/ThiF family protein [Eubacteriales bacterium]|nr:HesA/MoeB/ThiF family protein [Eubacteriales bacterium]